MKINSDSILFHPLTIFIFLFIAFIVAGAPARARDVHVQMNSFVERPVSN